MDFAMRYFIKFVCGAYAPAFSEFSVIFPAPKEQIVSFTRSDGVDATAVIRAGPRPGATGA